MQTSIPAGLLQTPKGREAEGILRKCVHCGFCNATCPTYQLLGNELDGPRGRIYLIKQVLEGHRPTHRTLTHLDRCLTCRACETTCPSGVEYGRLVDIGRELAERQTRRSWPEALARFAIRAVFARPFPVRLALLAGRAARPLLPRGLRRMMPTVRRAGRRPARRHRRRMLMLSGCVQRAAEPRINAAAARVFDRLGISLVRARGEGCCGALDHHLTAPVRAAARMRRNIDAWWPFIESGAEAIVVTASGCGAVIREYGHLLRDDPAYAEKAARVSSLARDPGEAVAEALAADEMALDRLELRLELKGKKEEEGKAGKGRGPRVAFHAPCTLSHGLRAADAVERVLDRCGIERVPVADGHLCCGSAGAWSMLEPTLSKRLLERKVEALERGRPDVIATANIGCLLHLRRRASRPVVHWIELLDPAPPGSLPGPAP